MYIKRVVLENVKGFAKVDFTFTRDNGSFEGWSVVTGENGTGKTALLKAIALAVVGPEVARALQPSFKGWVREGASNAAIAVEIVPHDVDSFNTGRRYEESFWSEIVFERAGSDVAAAP
ncbi:MAG: AAA family ATPase, partial [Deltaproteobacteria bacterium]|nr:AAA family ATPase [Deltaproteobacteria bacterium]